MPTVGGIIGVGIFKGLENYNGAGIVMGIPIKSYERAKKSFVTFKSKWIIINNLKSW